MSEGQYSAPTRTFSEGWLRFAVPPDVADLGTQHLAVSVDRLGVRVDPAPTLPTGAIDLDNVWASVPGRWSFDIDVDFLRGSTAEPGVAATVGDVTIVWEELAVTPTVTVGRLGITGLRQVEWGWEPRIRVDHDGQEVNLQMVSPGSIQSIDPGAVQDGFTFEAVPGFADLSGTWTVTIDAFQRDVPDPNAGVTSDQESIVGPWVLSFEEPPTRLP